MFRNDTSSLHSLASDRVYDLLQAGEIVGDLRQIPYRITQKIWERLGRDLNAEFYPKHFELRIIADDWEDLDDKIKLVRNFSVGLRFIKLLKPEVKGLHFISETTIATLRMFPFEKVYQVFLQIAQSLHLNYEEEVEETAVKIYKNEIRLNLLYWEDFSYQIVQIMQNWDLNIKSIELPLPIRNGVVECSEINFDVISFLRKIPFKKVKNIFKKIESSLCIIGNGRNLYNNVNIEILYHNGKLEIENILFTITNWSLNIKLFEIDRCQIKNVKLENVEAKILKERINNLVIRRESVLNRNARSRITRKYKKICKKLTWTAENLQ